MIQQQLMMMIQQKPYLLKVLLQSSAHQVIAKVLESDKVRYSFSGSTMKNDVTLGHITNLLGILLILPTTVISCIK